jgi:16S rRNA (cytosine1402-N4)-methyltransferase
MQDKSPPEKPTRRPRYRGTHPRRFEDRYKELKPEAYPLMADHIRAQGRTPAGTHVPIMVDEVMGLLKPLPGEVVADCTIGYAGHAVEFATRIAPGGRLVGLDVDQAELDKASLRLEATGVPFSLFRSHFAGLGKAMAAAGIEGFDIIFADLGVSSMQLDDASRGFSYKIDGPLDMRMDMRLRKTAADLVNTLDVEELSRIFSELADEPDHDRIAKKIVATRTHRPFRRTSELSDLILRAKKISLDDWREQAARGRAPHPAARVFQALRIVVNDEIGQLKELLRLVPYCLKPGGRVGILAFHSGEDGRVVEAFRQGFDAGIYEFWAENPIRPPREERRNNPRSSPALFRWARRAGVDSPAAAHQ